MTLESLPKELILMVTDRLPLSSIESLALTFSKQIMPVLLSQLQPVFAQRKHLKDMETRFGSLSYGRGEDISDIEKYRKELDIPSTAELRQPTPRERIQGLEYLDLKEDLYWLQPVDENTEETMLGYDAHTPLTEHDVANLQADAKKLNVVIPPSFFKFMASHELILRIPSCTANYFRVSGGIRKVPRKVDKQAGGYTMSIYSDQQGCGYWDLYLCPGEQGRHCVLSSSFDSGLDGSDMNESDGDAERENRHPDIPMACLQENDTGLEGVSFEQWLAMTYFEEWMGFIMLGGEMPKKGMDALKEYVRHVYVKK